ncbi:MAG TPA: hypothetical protein VGL91_07750 [Acidobacteriota bacterium]|jgi:hypothetical protein
MNKHPYLRAYMAGITAPTVFLLVVMTVFSLVRFVYHIPIPIERVIVFPMAVVPNLWGIWNMLYIWLDRRHRLPIGLHGAVLVFLLFPAGLTVAKMLGFLNLIPIPIFAILVIGLIVYYLAFKYLVGFFNEVLGIA